MRRVTTTEAAVLGLLALEGEQSGYDVLRNAQRSVAYVWAPARSQLYAVLPRLVAAGYATSRRLPPSLGPDKTVYELTQSGRRALAEWLDGSDATDHDALFLRVFLGGFARNAVLVEHVERFRGDVETRLAALRELDASNDREGHDWYHALVLRLGLDHAELQLRWAEWALGELAGRAAREPRA